MLTAVEDNKTRSNSNTLSTSSLPQRHYPLRRKSVNYNFILPSHVSTSKQDVTGPANPISSYGTLNFGERKHELRRSLSTRSGEGECEPKSRWGALIPSKPPPPSCPHFKSKAAIEIPISRGKRRPSTSTLRRSSSSNSTQQQQNQIPKEAAPIHALPLSSSEADSVHIDRIHQELKQSEPFLRRQKELQNSSPLDLPEWALPLREIYQEPSGAMNGLQEYLVRLHNEKDELANNKSRYDDNLATFVKKSNEISELWKDIQESLEKIKQVVPFNSEEDTFEHEVVFKSPSSEENKEFVEVAPISATLDAGGIISSSTEIKKDDQLEYQPQSKEEQIPFLNELLPLTSSKPNGRPDTIEMLSLEMKPSGIAEMPPGSLTDTTAAMTSSLPREIKSDLISLHETHLSKMGQGEKSQLDIFDDDPSGGNERQEDPESKKTKEPMLLQDTITVLETERVGTDSSEEFAEASTDLNSTDEAPLKHFSISPNFLDLSITQDHHSLPLSHSENDWKSSILSALDAF